MQFDAMKTRRLNVYLSSDGKTRLDLKPSYGFGAKIVACHAMINLLPGADFDGVFGINKMHTDNVAAPSTAIEIFSNPNVFYKWNIAGEIQSSGFTADRFDAWLLHEQMVCVVDPTLVHFVTAITMYVDIYYEYVKLSQDDMNRIALWQGGYGARG